MDRQLHISRVIFVSMADGTDRCFHWQNHDHDVFLFLRLQDLMQSLLYLGLWHHMATARAYCMSLLGATHILTLFVYLLCLKGVICYCFFFAFEESGWLGRIG
jgi:hypothetical protein